MACDPKGLTALFNLPGPDLGAALFLGCELIIIRAIKNMLAIMNFRVDGNIARRLMLIIIFAAFYKWRWCCSCGYRSSAADASV